MKIKINLEIKMNIDEDIRIEINNDEIEIIQKDTYENGEDDILFTHDQFQEIVEQFNKYKAHKQALDNDFEV